MRSGDVAGAYDLRRRRRGGDGGGRDRRCRRHLDRRLGRGQRLGQRGAHFGAGAEATVGLALHQLGDHVDQAARQGWPQPHEVRGVALQAGERGVGVGLALERHLAGEALVQHEAEGVEVGATVQPATAHLLRGQVLGRAHHHVVAGEVVTTTQRLGDAEVGQQHLAVGCDHHVARLHVAVDEPRCVRSVERARQRHADVHGQLGAELALLVQEATQRLAVDVLHHHGLAIAVGDGVEHLHDVRVVHAGDRDRLAAEPLGDHRIRGEVRLEQLDGDSPVQRQVGAEPHLRHAALRDATFQPVAPGKNGGSGRRLDGRHVRLGTLVAQGARPRQSRRSGNRCNQAGTLNATPMVPRPACEPITGPMSPTMISPV